MTRAFDSCKRGSAAEVSAPGMRGGLSVSGSCVSPENPHLAAGCSTAGEFSSPSHPAAPCHHRLAKGGTAGQGEQTPEAFPRALPNREDHGVPKK